MPNYKNVNVTCPDCGRSFKVKQFTTIDPRVMDKQINELNKRTLFQETCPYCHKTHEYPYSFTWKTRNIKLIYAVNEEDKEDYLDYYDGDDDVRITDNPDDFHEKRMIFDHDYDDRIVEVEKIIVLKGMKQRNPEVKKVRFGIARDPMGFITPVIYAPGAGESVPAEIVYHRLCNDAGDKLDEFEEQTLIVDQAWAEKFIAFAKLDQNEIDDLAVNANYAGEDTVGVSGFFGRVEQLEFNDNEEEAAEYIIENFDDTWDQIMAEYDGKAPLKELNEKHDELYNAMNDFSMILMNEKKYAECKRIMKKILDTIDFSDDRLFYMNMRRDYMYCIGETEGFDAELKYLNDWMKEDPEDPYLYGTEIDVWSSKDIDKAHQLALKYVDTPLKNFEDDWLLDSCENVAIDTKDKELSLKIDKARKAFRRF